MVIFVVVFVLLALVVYYHQSSDANANHCCQTNNALCKSDTSLLIAREDREEGEGFASTLKISSQPIGGVLGFSVGTGVGVGFGLSGVGVGLGSSGVVGVEGFTTGTFTSLEGFSTSSSIGLDGSLP